MATIRDLVGAIRKREGVEAVVVLGRDGLVIDSQTTDELTPDDLAAHVPSVLTAADELGGRLAVAHSPPRSSNTSAAWRSSRCSATTRSCSSWRDRTPTSASCSSSFGAIASTSPPSSE